jgi:hypothetical protein
MAFAGKETRSQRRLQNTGVLPPSAGGRMNSPPAWGPGGDVRWPFLITNHTEYLVPPGGGLAGSASRAVYLFITAVCSCGPVPGISDVKCASRQTVAVFFFPCITPGA